MTAGRSEQVDDVVAAVTAIDGVVGLYSGGPGSPATYLPGRTVSGVRIGDDSGQLSVVLEFRADTDLIDLADKVREVATSVAGVPMRVVVSDIEVVESDSAAQKSATQTAKELSA